MVNDGWKVPCALAPLIQPHRWRPLSHCQDCPQMYWYIYTPVRYVQM